MIALRPSADSNTIVLVVDGRIARADLPKLCEQVRALLESSDAELVVCDVGALVDPDAVTVDALARLQLTARRLARRVRIIRPCDELQELLALTGLVEVVPLDARLPLEARGQTEEREEAGRVEEEVRPRDPTA